jgi:hypothetical protein
MSDVHDDIKLASIRTKHPPKLLEVLGHNPSDEKVKSFLGIEDDSILEEANRENLEKMEKTYLRRRSNSDMVNRKENKKALYILGHDPSEEKIKARMGLDDSQVVIAEHERRILFEDFLAEQRRRDDYRIPMGRKKNCSKALNVLGCDPSKDRVMHLLGIEEEMVESAEKVSIERRELVMKRKRENADIRNKKYCSKALEVLGHDPSKEKVNRALGTNDDETKNDLLDPNVGTTMHNPLIKYRVLLSTASIALLAIVFMAQTVHT